MDYLAYCVVLLFGLLILSLVVGWYLAIWVAHPILFGIMHFILVVKIFVR